MSDQEFIQDFLAECGEGLDQLDSDLVQLEVRPDDAALLGRVFRTLHTIKGNCGFLKFERLGETADAGEALLGRVRDGLQPYTPFIADALLKLMDLLRHTLGSIQRTGAEGPQDFDAMVRTLRSLALDVAATADKLPEAIAPNPAALDPAATDSLIVGVPGGAGTVKAADRPIRQPVEHPVAQELLDDVAELSKETWVLDVLEPEAERDEPALDEALPDTESVLSVPEIQNAGMSAAGRSSVSSIRAPAAVPHSSAPKSSGPIPSNLPISGQTGSPPAAPRAASEPASSGTPATNIRVDVELLDGLMNLIGELVLARNQILQHTGTQQDPVLLSICQRLNAVTTDLQEGFMRTRMQKIGGMWQKFPRVVRDLARQCHKKVRLEMYGIETELDKSLIEAISAPLTHVIRNAIDHGIEPSLLRVKRGKREEGTLTLRAYHEGGQVHIEVSDDGAGINRDKVRQKAISVGLFSPEQSEILTDEELMDSVFMPGFSTADAVTSVSGRGVGMDVVKTQIEAVGGTVQIDSRPEQGTTIRMKVPLTLAIIPALVISCGDERFAIPQVNLLELVSVDAATAARLIEFMHKCPVYRLRGNLLPLVSLREVLGLPSQPIHPGVAAPVNFIVLQANGRRFGLVVDAINNNQEIVVKPLSAAVQGIPVYAGVTILGDGRVSLILDVLGLARLSGVLSRLPGQQWAQETADDAPPEFSQSLLVCETSRSRRIALPLAMIERLDEIPASALECSGDRPVLQYRGEILPLIDIGRVTYGADSVVGTGKTMRVVVCGSEQGRVGLVVERVLDIAATPADIRRVVHHAIEGSAIILGHVTDILDFERIVVSELQETTA